MSDEYAAEVAPAAEPDFYRLEQDVEEEDVYSPSSMPV